MLTRQQPQGYQGHLDDHYQQQPQQYYAQDQQLNNGGMPLYYQEHGYQAQGDGHQAQVGFLLAISNNKHQKLQLIIDLVEQQPVYYADQAYYEGVNQAPAQVKSLYKF